MTKQLEFAMYYRETLPGLEPATQPSQLRNLDRVELESGDSMGLGPPNAGNASSPKSSASAEGAERVMCQGSTLSALT